MNRPLRYCASPGCHTMVIHGRCDAHAIRRQESTRPDRDVRKWYRTERWTRLRRMVLAAACYQCAYCGRILLELDVDHIVKHSGNPRLFWDVSNLQALCKACHQAKTMDGD